MGWVSSVKNINVEIQSGANFTNIFQADFCVKVFCQAFLYLQFGFVVFWRKNNDAKDASKMLIKLTVGVNFANILQAPFVPVDLILLKYSEESKS